MEQKYCTLQTFPSSGFAAMLRRNHHLTPRRGDLHCLQLLWWRRAILDFYEVKRLHENIPEKNLNLEHWQVIIFCENPKANYSLTGLALNQAVVQSLGATKSHHCRTSGIFLRHLKSSRSCCGDQAGQCTIPLLPRLAKLITKLIWVEWSSSQQCQWMPDIFPLHRKHKAVKTCLSASKKKKSAHTGKSEQAVSDSLESVCCSLRDPFWTWLTEEFSASLDWTSSVLLPDLVCLSL